MFQGTMSWFDKVCVMIVPLAKRSEVHLANNFMALRCAFRTL